MYSYLENDDLVTLIFRVEGTGETVDGAQTIMTPAGPRAQSFTPSQNSGVLEQAFCLS